MASLQLTWDLESIFEGQSNSTQYRSFLDQIEKEIRGFRTALAAVPSPEDETFRATLTDVLEQYQSISEKLRQAGAFASCLVAQDAADETARGLQTRVGELAGSFQSVAAQLDGRLVETPDELWQEMLASGRLEPIAPAVDERRRRARRRLPPDREALIAELAVDGYHAWGDLYDEVSSSMRVTYEEDGETKRLSMGQAQNRMLHHPDRSVREEMFRLFEEAWAESASLCASALNHLGGFRQAVYRNRGWESILDEPLEINRMRRETLDAMWQAVSEAKPVLGRYLEHKAGRIGVPRLSFFDVDAPIGNLSTKLSYDDAADLIIRHFERYSSGMAAFARHAFQARWIEAEDREGKRAGGFCTSFPLTGESRIFLTYDQSISTAATIAHELGHAYHQSVFRETPYLMTRYPMTLAEMASTFAEQIVAEASLNEAKDEERPELLDIMARKSVAFLMNIHARFIFELAYYRERQKGIVPAERLNELIVSAQKEAYADSLGEYHPYFWASKLHFYITGTPFYNFPYTFGYLFSNGVAKWAREEAGRFEDRYTALLKETGYMQVEDVAKKHLGEDLTDVAFWRRAVDQALGPARELIEADTK